MDSAGKPIKVALLQHQGCNTAEDACRRVEDMARQAQSQGAELVITPELFTTPYFAQTEDPACFDLAEPIPGPTTQRMAQLARELGIFLSVSLFERRAPGLYHNTTVMLDPSGGMPGLYRKMHIPDDPAFYEKFYFTPGDVAPDCWQVLPVGSMNAGLLICWDQWFPEAARLTAMRGAQMLLYPTAIAWDAGEPSAEQQRQREAWQTIQRAHAIANGVYVIAVNRVGREGNLTFWGSSFVAGPGGEILAEGSTDAEQVILAQCDPGRIEDVRRMWPFFRDRRIDAYSNLTRRWC